LLLVEADDVAAPVHDHLLDLEGRRVFGGYALRMNLPITAGPGEDCDRLKKMDTNV
jgi:hypothetical protein